MDCSFFPYFASLVMQQYWSRIKSANLSLWCLQISTVLHNWENNNSLTILELLGNSQREYTACNKIHHHAFSCNTDRASNWNPSSTPPERIRNRTVKETFVNPERSFSLCLSLDDFHSDSFYPFLGIPSPVLVLGIRVQTIQRNYVSLSTLQPQIALIE